jgi:hypothetical protein
MPREMRYGTIKIWAYGKEDELKSKCSVYVTVNNPPKIRECDPELSSEAKELIEEVMVDANGNISNSGATYDPGGGPEGGYKWQIEQSSEEKILAALLDKRWDYRTAEGIVKETGVPFDQVRAFLESRTDVVWKSSVPDRKDRDLYTAQSRKAQSKDFWHTLSTFISKSSG